MKKWIYVFFLTFGLLLCQSIIQSTTAQSATAQNLPKEAQDKIGAYLTQTVRQQAFVRAVRIDSVKSDKRTLTLYANVNLSYIGFDRQLIGDIYSEVGKLLPNEYKKQKLEIYSDGYKIEDYVLSDRNDRFVNKVDKPLKSNVSRPYGISKGLENRHLAFWQSHGWYYEQKLSRWEWQRARVFQTVEDLYTQSYVLPYLVPMLENAGANVFLPRERDTQSHEVIVDNDPNRGKSKYNETEGKESWTAGDGVGFAHKKEQYLDGENPFMDGTFRQVKTTTKAAENSVCEWLPEIPEKGKYAVYVSYRSVKNSATDALYTVHHLGGTTQFAINQTMGGGTWIFLGFFSFDQGANSSCKVTLSNQSAKGGRVVTADAVKIGGGMGNVARLPHASGEVTENAKSSDLQANNVKKLPDVEYTPETSDRPRYVEGARYWLQWAGIPDSIYTMSKGKNDYTDDYQSRGHWVNYMAGGSTALPKRDGLNIPIDLSFAFHTDAGTTMNDSIIGTLGICYAQANDNKFANGRSRLHSRDLTSLVMDDLVKDIRAQYDPKWTRRHIWNRSYHEARVPQVPAMLLELLSHQNMADMRYGLDPRFQFTVSRSIYKGTLKYVSKQYNTDYVVQPLPVKGFSATFAGDTQVSLAWTPINDPLEPTAKADKYIVYTRIDDGDFDNGRLTNDTKAMFDTDIAKDKIYSFKIAAVNAGGESFPSEILSVCRKSDEKGCVLIVNGFDRLSAPFSFATSDSIAGFVDAIDHGVPDKTQYNYIGSQKEFRRKIPWMDDDASGFGDSNSDFETTVIAGNTFDYPKLHGASITKAGYSFVSVSTAAVMNGSVDMKSYPLVDLILGKQKQTTIGRGVFPAEFKTFPTELQNRISEYCAQGGNIFVSGAYVASDLWDTPNPKKEDQEFANKVLRYKWRVDRAATTGHVKAVLSPIENITGQYEFYTKLNSACYAVESPDGLEPVGDKSFTVFRYSENNLSAGIASDDGYKTCVLGFPFEVIKEDSKRDILMNQILNFMFGK